MKPHQDTALVSGILETSLYVSDLSRSAVFYKSLFGSRELARDDRLCALSLGSTQVLLLFKHGASKRAGVTPGGTIPPHDGGGELHMAVSIASEGIDLWRQRLGALGIDIESTVHWPHGGTSLYVRDPDNHSIELATPGTWEIY